MPLLSVKAPADILLGALSESMSWNVDGDLFLAPDNPIPNQYLADFDEEGAIGFSFEGMPEKTEGHDVSISRPGSAKVASMRRQNTSTIPVTDPEWVAEMPWVPGPREEGSGSRASTPEVEAVPNANRGFQGGTYGWCWWWENRFLNPTTPTSYCFFDLQENQRPTFPVPEEFAAGAAYWVIGMTKKNGQPASARRQVRVPIGKLKRGGKFTLRGPWKNRGPVPKKNTSGVPRGPRPTKNGHVREVPSDYDLAEGTWRFGIQLKNGRGPGLVGFWGPYINVKGEVVRRLVNADEIREYNRRNGSPSSAESRSEGPSHEAEGKRSAAESPYVAHGGRYMGEEIDFEESRLVSLMNAERQKYDLPPLILNRDLNRMAYRELGGDTPEPEYPGGIYLTGGGTVDDDAGLALASLPSDEYLKKEWAAVGVAREPHGNDLGWCVVFGDRVVTWDDVDEEEGPGICATVDPDGTIHHFTHDEDGNHVHLQSTTPEGVEFALSTGLQGWDNVNDAAKRLGLRYSGSFQQSYQNGVNTWKDKCAVAVSTSGSDVSVMDGSLPSNINAVTYSDGRIYLNAYVFANSTGNNNQSVICHEVGHCLGLDHSSQTAQSVMRPNTRRDLNTNIDTPQQDDVSAVVSKWGAAGSTGGTGGGGTGGGGTGGGEEVEEPPQPEYEDVNLGVKRKTGFLCRVPKAIRNPKLDGWSYTYWVEHTPPGGAPTTYRAQPKGRRGKNVYFDGRAPFRRGIVIHGYPPDKEPPRLPIGLVAEELPEEDLSVVEAPDPEFIPDVPEPDGRQTLPAGNYVVGLQDVKEGGTKSRMSLPVRKSITSGQMLAIRPRRTVNLLPNAEGAKVDAKGVAEGCTVSGVGTPVTNQHSVEGGIFALDALANTPTQPTYAFPLIPVPEDGILTVGGILGVPRYGQGAARVNLRYLDESGAVLSTINVSQLQTGAEAPFVKTYAPGTANEIPAEAASVQLVLTMAPAAAGGNVNMRLEAKKLRVLGMPVDLRRVVLADDGSYSEDAFNTEPTDPIPGSSFVAVGAPEDPPGASEPVQETPPLGFEDFEGALKSGFVLEGSGAVTGAYTTSTPIYGARSYEIQDASNTQGGQRGIGFVLASARGRAASRVIYEVMALPQLGYVDFHPIYDESTTVIANLRLNYEGTLAVIIRNSSGSVTSTQRLTSGIRAGTRIDAEMIFQNGGSGYIAVSVGLDGELRTQLFRKQFAFGSRRVKRARAGTISASEAKVRYRMKFDQFVITEGGDVADRERPTAPPDYTVPDPDRPLATLSPKTFREFSPPDPDDVDTPEIEKRIGQLFFFIRREDGTRVIRLLREDLTVKPGETRTVAMFRKWCAFGAAAPGLRVVLEGEPGAGVEPRRLSVGRGATGSLGEMAGTRWSWHPAGAANVEDEYLTFTVPEMIVDEDGFPDMSTAYTRARLELVLTPGIYILQEPTAPRGALTTFAARDAKRGFGRATAGEATFVFDSLPEAYELAIPRTDVHYVQYGVKVEAPEDLPVGVEAVPYYSRSTDEDLYSPESQDPEELAVAPPGVGVRPEEFLKTRIAFTGDGRRGPTVPSGGIFLSTWHPDAVMTREDGSHFPGIVFVDNTLFETDYPDISLDSAGGSFLGVRETDDIGRMRDIGISASTEAAVRELENLSLQEKLLIEVPMAGGKAAGRIFTVRLREQVAFAPEDIAPRVVNGHRRLFSRSAVAEAEIVGRADLLPPIPDPVRFSGVSERIA